MLVICVGVSRSGARRVTGPCWCQVEPMAQAWLEIWAIVRGFADKSERRKRARKASDESERRNRARRGSIWHVSIEPAKRSRCSGRIQFLARRSLTRQLIKKHHEKASAKNIEETDKGHNQGASGASVRDIVVLETLFWRHCSGDKSPRFPLTALSFGVVQGEVRRCLFCSCFIPISFLFYSFSFLFTHEGTHRRR